MVLSTDKLELINLALSKRYGVESVKITDVKVKGERVIVWFEYPRERKPRRSWEVMCQENGIWRIAN